MKQTLLFALLAAGLCAAPLDESVIYGSGDKGQPLTVVLPYAIEHYESPVPTGPTFEMPRNWRHHDDDDHGHHGQVPEPSTWALIGCGLVAVAWRRR